MWRLGFLGPERPTLEEAGTAEGLTRERIRQLVARLEGRMAATAPPDPMTIDTVAAVLEMEASAWVDPGEVLYDAGLTDAPVSDDGIEAMLRLYGRPDAWDAYAAKLELGRSEHSSVVGTAAALTRSVGVACPDWVSEKTDVAVTDIRQMLQHEDWCEFLAADWFWDPTVPRGRNRTENITTKMLAACGPLPLGEVREGLDRVFRYRQGKMPYVPPTEALRLLFEAHPRFDLNGDLVSLREAADPMLVLDDVERKLYTILRDAPGGVLDRSELTRRGLEAGINRNTLSVFTSYSPILDNPVQDRWTLRGHRVSPAALAAARQPRRVRFHDESWLPSGSLRVRSEVGQQWSHVLSIPAAYVRYVSDRSFAAVDEGGALVGAVRFNQAGNSWGYSRFLQGLNAGPGDLLVADFNLATATVVLRLERTPEAGELDG
jgi:hypothetical protein